MPELAKKLSPRQTEVLVCLATGKTIKQTSDELGISRQMIDTHLNAVKKKVNARTKEEALALSIKNKLIAF